MKASLTYQLLTLARHKIAPCLCGKNSSHWATENRSFPAARHYYLYAGPSPLPKAPYFPFIPPSLRLRFGPSIATLYAAAIAVGLAQQPAPPTSTLTLTQAKVYALRKNPQFRSADSTTQATESLVKEVRAARFANVSGLAAGVEPQQQHDSRGGCSSNLTPMARISTVTISLPFRSMANSFKSLLESGKPAIGSWIAFADPYSVELMADVGFDWLLIDTEHVPIDRQGLRTILVSMRGSGSAAIVRLSSNSQDHFQTALDLGAHGVVVPMINTPEDAAKAVSFCRYPPFGIRGFSPTRASRYFQDLRAYAEKANDETALIIQIETPQAVEGMDEILKTKRIDGVFIGPSDLASFMSLPAQTDHPAVQQMVDKAIERARAHSIPFGLPTWSAEECLTYVNRGGQILTVGSDLQYLARAARTGLTGVRSLLPSNSV